MEMYTYIVWIVLAAGQVAMAALRMYVNPQIGQAVVAAQGTSPVAHKNAPDRERAVELYVIRKIVSDSVFRKVWLLDTS
ncbi:hypothetical protein ACFQPF_08030 [Fictibacillus iocasae]|uniref:Uncharacterized protein n=1 Tax=Fictibacillus iocasae TaxID=2715437 RepID=A0ABW2NPA8_9BACL